MQTLQCSTYYEFLTEQLKQDIHNEPECPPQNQQLPNQIDEPFETVVLERNNEMIEIFDSSDENEVKPNLKVEANEISVEIKNIKLKAFNPNTERYDESTINKVNNVEMVAEINGGPNSSRCLNSQVIKYFECDHCHYTCQRKSQLIKHMQQHIEHKPHKCDVCFKEFSWLCTFRRNVNILKPL